MSIHSALMSSPPAALLSPAARKAFEDFSTDEQKQVVDKMSVLIRDLRDETNVHLVLDQCYWQQSQFFRVRRNPVINAAILTLKTT
jgi:hypothetical protein